MGVLEIFFWLCIGGASIFTIYAFFVSVGIVRKSVISTNDYDHAEHTHECRKGGLVRDPNTDKLEPYDETHYLWKEGYK